MWGWNLPLEISLRMLQLLPLKDIEQCRLACKQWRQYLDQIVTESEGWLAAQPVLHHVSLHPHNALPMEREQGLYAFHPIVNVGNDFFILERKAGERFASAVHVVNRCDYEGSVKLTKQTTWHVPIDVLRVDQVFAVYSKPCGRTWKESCCNTVEMFERRTFKPLSGHAALTNVVAMCQKDNAIYHLCLLNGDDTASDKRFKLFFLRNLQWQELASTAVVTLTKHLLKEEHTSLCGLDLMRCRPHMQVENSLVMWTCGTHSNRLFLANVEDGTVTKIELNEECYNGDWRASFKCPTVLFGGNILGIRVRSRLDWEFVKMDLINMSTNQLLEECPENRNIQQICSEKFLIYVMELHIEKEFLLVCVEKNDYKTRKANFPYYPHGFYNDFRMVFSTSQEQLFIHIISNEIPTSLRCSNHVFVFDLTQDDLNLGMRVFTLGLSHYPPAISFSSGLVMQDVHFIEMNDDTQWFSAIKMSSLNSHGFSKLLQKCQGTEECVYLSELAYLTKCNEVDWSKRTSHICHWCGAMLNDHRNIRQNVISPRMESCIYLFHDRMQRESESEDPAINNEERRNRLLLGLKGRCKGFLPRNNEFTREYNNYLICKGDGITCFHARWKNA